jgi:hypothetical protein
MGTKAYDNALDLITFSRASGGTALRKISYGSELVTNGTFDTDTTGAIPATWTTNNANASLIKQADGTALFSSTSFAYAKIQDASRPVLPVGVYEVSFDITDWVAGLTLVHVGINSSGNIIGGNGSYSYLYTSTVEQAYEFQIRPNGGGTGSFKIDNISVKEVLFDQPDGTLTLFNHPDNIPRIDYNPDGTVKGLLIEEQRVNLLTYSEDFTNAYWPKNDLTVSASGELDPAGGNNAYELIESATTANHLLNKAGLTSTTSLAHTNSIYAKANTRNWIRVQNQSPTSSWVNFNLSTGEFGLTGGGEDSFTAENVGNGWYRISLTSTPVAALTGPQIFIIDSDRGGGSPSYLGDGTSSILIYGAQFEQGSFPTSYIPTSGATATRSADIASIPVTDFGYNQKAGTVVVDYTEFHNYTASPYPRVLALTNGYSPREGLEILSFNNVGNAAGYVGGSSIFSFVGATSTKTAFSASENNFSASFAGGSVLTDTAGAMPSATLLELGKYSSAAFLNGHIKSIQYFPRRLSNAQLQELTS